MRKSNDTIDVPAPEPQAGLDIVVGVAAVTTLALVLSFAAVTYPVLVGVIAPLLGAAIVG